MEREESQHWSTYRYKDSNALYLAPGGNNQTWTSHEPVTATDKFLIYEYTPGTPCNPPRHTVRISLHLKTTYTIIYSNSTTTKVLIRNTMNPEEPLNNKAMKRVVGLKNTKTGSIREIALALEQGTLQVASDGLVNKIDTSAWVVEPQ